MTSAYLDRPLRTREQAMAELTARDLGGLDIEKLVDLCRSAARLYRKTGDEAALDLLRARVQALSVAVSEKPREQKQ